MDVASMTRDQLRAYAKEHKLPGYSRMKLPELRDLVAKHGLVAAAAKETTGRFPTWQQAAHMIGDYDKVKVRPRGNGFVYPTGGAGTFASSAQLARHLPGFDPGQFA